MNSKRNLSSGRARRTVAAEGLAVVSLVGVHSPSHPVSINQLGINTLAGDLSAVFRHRVRVYSHCTQFAPVKEIVAALVREQPRVVALSLHMGSLPQLGLLMEELRAQESSFAVPPLIVLGNVLATFAAETLLGLYPGAVAVVGEGELALRGIVNKVLDARVRYEDIPNIMFVAGGKVVATPRQVFDLREAAIPTYDFMDRVVENDGHVWIEASRGCNSRCVFCSRYPVRNGGWTPFPATKVVEEMAFLSSCFGVRHFRFSDDDFMGHGSAGGMAHAAGIAREIIERKLAVTFDISTKVKAIYDDRDTPAERAAKREIFVLLKRAGLTQVFLGVESGCDRQLRRFGKGVIAAENRNGVQAFAALGLQVVMGFITIDYLMTLDELEENLDFLTTMGTLERGSRVFVSDPLTTLRIQEGSAYKRLMEKDGLLLNRDEGLLTYEGVYRDRRVERLVRYLRAWRDKTFSMVYVLKNRVSLLSMENSAAAERAQLEEFLYRFKWLDYHYLLTLLLSMKKSNGGEDGNEQSLVTLEYETRRMVLVRELQRFTAELLSAEENIFARDLMAQIEQIALRDAGAESMYSS